VAIGAAKGVGAMAKQMTAPNAQRGLKGLERHLHGLQDISR